VKAKNSQAAPAPAGRVETGNDAVCDEYKNYNWTPAGLSTECRAAVIESLQHFDQLVDNWFRAARADAPRLTSFMGDISALGGYTVLTLVVLFTVGLSLVLHRYRTAAFVLAAALSGTLLESTLKQVFHRARPSPPYAAVVLTGTNTFSFPSGHSMLAAVIYLTLSMIETALIPRRRTRAYVVGMALLLVGLIGISRVYLGVHYLTDVVGGWTLGLAWALLCRFIEFHWVLLLERRDAAARHEPMEAGVS
jgi:membrane-associated phospholipid phosphatase